MLYKEDYDLEFLGKCSNDELESLFKILAYDRDGKKRMYGKLLDSEEYKTYGNDYKKYWKRITGEFQLYGSGCIPFVLAGNAVYNISLNMSEYTLFRKRKKTEEEVEKGMLLYYNDIINNTLDMLDIDYSKEKSLEIKEEKFIESVFKRLITKLSEIEMIEMLSKMGIEILDLKNISLESLIERIKKFDGVKCNKAVNIIGEKISSKGINYIFGGTGKERVIPFIVIIIGLRKLTKERK